LGCRDYQTIVQAQPEKILSSQAAAIFSRELSALACRPGRANNFLKFFLWKKLESGNMRPAR
jgi:hypothetical protein